MAEVILNCAQHPRVTCCIVNFDGAHVPGRCCLCEVVNGRFMPRPDCPVDQHAFMWLRENAEW